MSDWDEKRKLDGAGYSWRRKKRTPHLAAVFVHGFEGDALGTWTYPPAATLRELVDPRNWFGSRESVELFKLLIEDAELEAELACDYYSFAHNAGFTSKSAIGNTAGDLLTFIESYVAPNRVPVVLIAHSFGGLVCRQAILDLLKKSREAFPVAGLMMLGTPNNGTEIAHLARKLGSGSGADMTPLNDELADLNKGWAASILGADPDVPPGHRASLLCRFVVGIEDRIVPESSAGNLARFADLKYVGCGHQKLVKPSGYNDRSYLLIRNFLRDAKEAMIRRTGERAARYITHRIREATLTGRWVREEEAEIVLKTTGDPHWLRCRVRNVRRGGLTQRRFNLCIYLAGQRPATEKIDFGWGLGQGNLTKQQYAALGGRLTEEPTRLLEVEELTVRQGDTAVEYTALEPRVGHGWALLPFETPQPILEDRPYDELVVTFTTRVNRGHDWYHWELERTVAERLTLVFVAPFEAKHINTLARAARFTPPTPSGDGYIHRVTAEQPLPLGRSVTWVFPRVRASTPPTEEVKNEAKPEDP